MRIYCFLLLLLYLLIGGCSPQKNSQIGGIVFIFSFIIFLSLHIFYYKKVIPMLHFLVKIIFIVSGFLLGIIASGFIFEYFGLEKSLLLRILFYILSLVIATPFYFNARLYSRIEVIEKSLKEIKK